MGKRILDCVRTLYTEHYDVSSQLWIGKDVWWKSSFFRFNSSNWIMIFSLFRFTKRWANIINLYLSTKSNFIIIERNLFFFCAANFSNVRPLVGKSFLCIEMCCVQKKTYATRTRTMSWNSMVLWIALQSSASWASCRSGTTVIEDNN